ncbi:GNAT family N-acetyltransferase [Sinomonas sp. P47F7]|uniref:GNAT family N-acetyltransferase n=1 Tax=Sinomonas sp. P47F7 TaxID=3410987 RepID=UPI003BF45E6C
MVVLVRPSADLHAAWLEAHFEWGSGQHEDGFGLLGTDDVRSPHGFRAFVDRLITEESSPGNDGCAYRWIAEDAEVLGGIALRHENARNVDVLGHVGYGIRPSARGRGLAEAALTGMLSLARERGMKRVLLACFANNIPSVRTIEKCGGSLDRTVVTDDGDIERYGIAL